MVVSIIIPVYNAEKHLSRCLTALQETHFSSWECIVVDDCSTDNSNNIAQQFDVRLFKTPTRSGPAIARNLGATQAQGDYLFFIDSDVLIQQGTVGHAVATMQANSEFAACFGSYDNSPSEANLLSQYRNLQHHYVHQMSQSEASTFWSGCGIIKRSVFEKLGGFRTLTPGRPSIEDIELGYRLCHAGYKIHLEKLLTVKHLKRWSLWTILKTDIRDRAWPWTRLIVQAGGLPNDLNLQMSQRMSTAVTYLGLLFILASIWQSLFLIGVLICMAILWRLNGSFYRFLMEQRGVWFTVRAVWIHWLYFFYSGATFVSGVIFWGLVQREFLSRTAV